MKKVLFMLTFLLILMSCGTAYRVEVSDFGVGVTSAYTYENDTLDVNGIDSMLVVDKLPKVEKWASLGMKDAETSVGYKYSTLYDRTSGIVYTIKQIGNEKYVVSKRILNKKVQ